MRRLSVASNSTQPARRSLELQKKSVENWERKTREALMALMQTHEKPTLRGLTDSVNDSIREIFEAAVAGSAAEEELSRAIDLASETGVATALLREESACQLLSAAHDASMLAVRQLLAALGYVGPLDKMLEMPRPLWTGDLTLIGTVGLLSAATHAACVSKRPPENGGSLWSEVMRCAKKLKDVCSALQQTAIGSGSVIDAHLAPAVLGVEYLGEIFDGQWGFGKITQSRRFDGSYVIKLRGIKGELEQASHADQQLTALRLLTRFKSALLDVDIASTIDVDGPVTAVVGLTLSQSEDAAVYGDLAIRARQILQDLQQVLPELSLAPSILLSVNGDTHTALRDMLAAANAAFRSISTLLIISKEQAELVSNGMIGQIGKRAFGVMTERKQAARQSFVSSQSQTSRQSHRSMQDSLRERALGLEEEFLDEGDYDLRSEPPEMSTEALAGTSVSQLPLDRQRSPPNAGSSTSSLHQSDSSSQKRNRSSILRVFRRNRNSDEIDTGQSRKASNRKLVKLLGEDSFEAPPSTSSAPALPELPWYMQDEYGKEELVFDDKGGVKAGTLPALVAKLTPHGSTGTNRLGAANLTTQTPPSSTPFS